MHFRLYQNDCLIYSAEDFGTTWNNLPLDDHLKLTQYLATFGKRKKREAEAEALPEAETDEYRHTLVNEAKIFNFTTSGLGSVTRWFSVGIFKYKPGYKSHDLLSFECSHC